MEDEYAGREVAVAAIGPLLEFAPQEGAAASALRRIDLDGDRISWDDFCDLLEAVGGAVHDLREIGAWALTAARSKYRRRIGIARRVLTLEDVLRFVLYPRTPVDFSCVNVAITCGPGRIDVVASIPERYREAASFFEIMKGAAEEFTRIMDLPGGAVSAQVEGRQAHYVFTFTQTHSLACRTHRSVSHQLYTLYSIFVLRSTYAYLVRGRRMFEEQVVERARIEAKLTQSELVFERRIQHTDHIIAEFNPCGALIYVSPNVQRVLGISVEEFHENPQSTLHEEDLERVLDEIGRAHGEARPCRIHDFRLLDAHGSPRWFDATLDPFTAATGERHMIAVLRDATERRRFYEERQQLDRQLEHTQRLEALGVLTGGIAHDFNNLLLPIIGQAEIASLELEDRPDLRAQLDTIRTAAEKASDLVRQLMVYAGTEPPSAADIDLAKETEELLQLVKTSIPPDVTLQVSFDRRAFVRGDVSQLRQVVMNLIINAAEAIGESKGTIDLSVRRSADSVVLTVRDDGCGMDASIRERVFDPFYTTKFAGRGLGLSAVMGIVRAHGGELILDSEPGRGTCIEVKFAAVFAHQSDTDDPRASASRGSGTVLLVDDEPAVREVGKRMLEALGYEVELADDGAEALERLEDGNFAALIVDLMMPRVNGREVLARVRQRQPRLPVILVSGYGALLLGSESDADVHTRFLSKPFRLQELGAVLGELTSSAETPPAPSFGAAVKPGPGDAT